MLAPSTLVVRVDRVGHDRGQRAAPAHRLRDDDPLADRARALPRQVHAPASSLSLCSPDTARPAASASGSTPPAPPRDRPGSAPPSRARSGPPAAGPPQPASRDAAAPTRPGRRTRRREPPVPARRAARSRRRGGAAGSGRAERSGRSGRRNPPAPAGSAREATPRRGCRNAPCASVGTAAPAKAGRAHDREGIGEGRLRRLDPGRRQHPADRAPALTDPPEGRTSACPTPGARG